MNTGAPVPLAALASNFFNEYLILIGLAAFFGFVILAPQLNKLLRRLFPHKEDITVENFAASRGLAPVPNANPDIELQVFEGRIDGLDVKLSAGPDAPILDERKRPSMSNEFTCIAVHCSRPWPQGLQLWSESGLERFRKRVADLKEVEIGDAELDDNLIIRGALSAEIKALLTLAPVRKEVLRLFNDWPESIVDDQWVRCEQSDSRPTKAMIETMLQDALALAKVLDQAAR